MIFKADNDVVLVNAVKAAVQAGYRHFDCAYIYFNEKHVGQGIREAIAESNGALKREDFFITSKLWNTYHSKERVQKCLDHILECLGFDYLDLFLMHWSMGHKVMIILFLKILAGSRSQAMLSLHGRVLFFRCDRKMPRITLLVLMASSFHRIVTMLRLIKYFSTDTF